MGYLNSFHHRGVVLCDFLSCFHGFSLKRQGCIKIFLAIHLNSVCGVCCFLGNGFVFSDSLSNDFSGTGFLFDLSSFDLDFFRSLNKHRLFSFEFSLHNTDGALSLDKTIVTVCISVSQCFDFLSFLFKQNFEG